MDIRSDLNSYQLLKKGKKSKGYVESLHRFDCERYLDK